jgi:hypothetical protein
MSLEEHKSLHYLYFVFLYVDHCVLGCREYIFMVETTVMEPS